MTRRKNFDKENIKNVKKILVDIDKKMNFKNIKFICNNTYISAMSPSNKDIMTENNDKTHIAWNLKNKDYKSSGQKLKTFANKYDINWDNL